MSEVVACAGWIGVDVSKKKIDVYLLRSDGRGKSKVFANDASGHVALMAWVEEQGVDLRQAKVCLEATGAYGEALALALHDAGVWVAVINPARIAAFAKAVGQRTKTDKLDARLIAYYASKHPPRRWTPPSKEVRTLQALVRRLDDLLGMYSMECARLKQAHPEVLRSVQAMVGILGEAMENLRKAVAEHIEAHPKLRQQAQLLGSIPGLGAQTLCRVLAYLGPVTRFDNVRQVVAFVGLNPRIRQSGQAMAVAGISRQGVAALRKALYMPALVAMRHNPVIRPFAERLRANGKRPKQVVVAAMRKLLHLIYGVLKSQRPFDPSLGLST